MTKVKHISLFILLLILVTSCATRKTFKANEKVRLVEKGTIERKAAGDRVYVEFPKKAKDRPKSTTKRYKGESGAIVDVPFDKSGNATGFLADCPEVSEKEKYDREMDYKIKTKETERAMSELLMNKTYSILLKLGMMGFGAWAIIGISKSFFNREKR